MASFKNRERIFIFFTQNWEMASCKFQFLSITCSECWMFFRNFLARIYLAQSSQEMLHCKYPKIFYFSETKHGLLTLVSSAHKSFSGSIVATKDKTSFAFPITLSHSVFHMQLKIDRVATVSNFSFFVSDKEISSIEIDDRITASGFVQREVHKALKIVSEKLILYLVCSPNKVGQHEMIYQNVWNKYQTLKCSFSKTLWRIM